MEILYEEDDIGFVGLSWEDNLKVWMIHINTPNENFAKNWSLSKAKHYLKVKEKLRDIMVSRGIYEVYGLSDTPKEVKYNLLLGAEDTGVIVTTDKGVKKYLVKGVV